MRQPVIGKQILEIVTSGMYSSALMGLREYVQNSVDAIDEAVAAEVLSARKAAIDVSLDGATRCIHITDNGIGVSHRQVEEKLSGCGVTTKQQDRSRGFRGIGRLGGLGYCDSVQFETRSDSHQKVAVVTWDARRLREACRESNGHEDARGLLRRIVTINSRTARGDEGAHFFRVVLRNVHRFHTDALMNASAVAQYLGRVGPVPFDRSQFSYAEEVEEHLAHADGYRTYIIRVNGTPVYRPHADTVPVSGQAHDKVKGIQLFCITGRGGRDIGRGWYAKMAYLASIPPSVSMRGIRVRQGNIEVGDDQFLSEWFTERRFAGWHVGEIHLDYAVKANARRDGFEQSPEYEAFLEHAHSLGKHLSHLCRAASKGRSHRVAVTRMLDRVDSLLGLPFFLDKSHVDGAVATAEATLDRVEHLLEGSPDGTDLRERLHRTKKHLGTMCGNSTCLHDLLDGRSVTHCAPKTLLTAIAKGILCEYGKHRSPESLLTAILRPYLTARGRQLSSSRGFPR